MQICARCSSEFIVENFRSPLPCRFLETNDPPLPTDTAMLHYSLINTERELATLNEIMSAVGRTLQALESRKKAVEISLRANRGALSSIRCIPREVLAEIFSFALADAANPNKNSLPNHDHVSPFTGVCRIWREAALSFSNFWTNLDIAFHPGFRQPRCTATNVVHSMFSNANGRPVRMGLHVPLADTESRAVWGAAIQHSSLWRTAGSSIHPDLLPQLGTLQNLSNLHSFSLYAVIEVEADPDDEDSYGRQLVANLPVSILSNIFSIAPALQTLILWDVTIVGTPDLSKPWCQLTRFKFAFARDVSAIEVFKLLGLFPNLQNLEVTGFHDREVETSDIPFITMARLVSLRVRENVATPFLTHLICPTLEEIYLDGRFGDVIELARRSNCSLKRLGFINVWRIIEEQGLAQLFRVTANIVALHIEDRLWLQFIPSALESSTHLPRLEHLSFSSYVLSLRSALVNSLTDVLLAREQPITSVTIFGRPSESSQTLEFCNKYRDELQIVVEETEFPTIQP